MKDNSEKVDKAAIRGRFIKAFEFLQDNGYVKSKSDFAYQIGISPQIFTEILGQRMHVSCDTLAEIHRNTPLNPLYILTGEKPVLKEGKNVSLNVPLNVSLNEPEAEYSSKSDINYLEIISSQRATIEAQKITINSQQLTIELLRREKNKEE